MQDAPERYIHWKLTSDPASADLLGFRVYPIIAPQGATRSDAGGVLSFAVYKRISTTRDTVTLTLDGAEAPAIQIQVDLYAETYGEARRVAAVVSNVLHRATASGWGNTVLYVLQKAEQDDLVVPIDGKAMPIYSVGQTYEVRIAESA